jgi:hypothetical protein
VAATEVGVALVGCAGGGDAMAWRGLASETVRSGFADQATCDKSESLTSHKRRVLMCTVFHYISTIA